MAPPAPILIECSISGFNRFACGRPRVETSALTELVITDSIAAYDAADAGCADLMDTSERGTTTREGH